MDAGRFDTLVRSLSSAGSRRTILGTVMAGSLGMVGIARTEAKKAKRKKKPLPFNAFGCLNVGAKCRGKAALCCSGICQGKKPKNGKKDKSKCVAHNTGNCTPPRDVCLTNSITVSECDSGGICTATTGKAAFCASFTGGGAASCRACRTDPDCEALGFAPGSACVILTGGACNAPGSNCAGVNDSSGTACLAPSA